MAKILIADDSRFQVEVMAAHLRPKGFSVVSAADALQTWMTALREQPDAILLDINMPGGTGIEVLKRLRISAKTQHIPVIVVSGNSEKEIEQTARELGACEFLHKPVDVEALEKKLTRLMKSASIQ